MKTLLDKRVDVKWSDLNFTLLEKLWEARAEFLDRDSFQIYVSDIFRIDGLWPFGMTLSDTPTGERSVGIGNMPFTTTLEKDANVPSSFCRFSCALIY